MNDYWYDPLEEPEPPECPKCSEGAGEVVTIYAANGDSGEMFQCDVCGHRWAIPQYEEPDPPDFSDELKLEDRAVIRRLGQENKILKTRYEALLSQIGDIRKWYETADRSPQSWAELDRIMEDDND